MALQLGNVRCLSFAIFQSSHAGWNFAVSFSISCHWNNCHMIFLIKIAKRLIVLYQEEFLQILSACNVIKSSHSVCQFVMDGFCYLSEGMLGDYDFGDSRRGSAMQNWLVEFLLPVPCAIVEFSISHDVLCRKRNPYMFKSGAAFDQMKMTNMVRMAIWQRSGIMLYSTTSNRYHISVAPRRTPADKFLSFHSRTSATARGKQRNPWPHRLLVETLVIQMMQVNCPGRKEEQHTFPSTKKLMNRLVPMKRTAHSPIAVIVRKMRMHGSLSLWRLISCLGLSDRSVAEWACL